MSGAAVRIEGVAGVRKMLRPFLEPELSQNLQAATKASAKVYGKALRAELRPVSKRMAKAVRVKTAKRDRPASVVGSRRKVAFFFHMVIGGTKDHGPRRASYLTWRTKDGQYLTKSRVRGVKARPLVDVVAQRNAAEAERAFEQVISGLGK